MEENKLKKNIILALILAASMTMAMTSCGKTGEEVSNGVEQSSYNDAVGIIAPEVTAAVVTPHEVIAPEALDIEPTQEILDASPDSKKIQLGNHVFTLPVKLDDILNSGAVVTNDVDIINCILEGWGSEYVEFKIDGCNYSLPFKNADFSEQQLKAQLKDGSNFYYNSEDGNGIIILPKGISVGSTVDELKAAWGKPTTDNINEYIRKTSLIQSLRKNKLKIF